MPSRKNAKRRKGAKDVEHDSDKEETAAEDDVGEMPVSSSTTAKKRRKERRPPKKRDPSYYRARRAKIQVEEKMEKYCSERGGVFYAIYFPSEAAKTEHGSYFDIRAGDEDLLEILDLALQEGSFTGWRSARAMFDKRRRFL